VRQEMNFTATPPSPLADAVQGRTYGFGSTCGAGSNAACAPLTYTIQSGGGLGGYSYSFAVPAAAEASPARGEEPRAYAPPPA
jgi:hypothetical protein